MAISNGPNLGIMVDGALGDQHYNQFMSFLRAVDGLLMGHAKSATTTAQPASPADGDVYVLPASPTGTNWSGQGQRVARYSSAATAWEFFAPKKGWTISVEDTNSTYWYDGSAWKFLRGYGTTANRPAASAALIGGQYFDTTLGKPIWSTGSAWVDATGLAV
ncbi:structural protein [Pseudomonas phage AN14]|uniref:Structural protein n=1 Tax=Pseudomonas phage AN14 TaxID=1868597 RepID=A0A1B0Z0A0_9CAUD|nr:structural protein [Pseudomonas phage AN14]